MTVDLSYVHWRHVPAGAGRSQATAGVEGASYAASVGDDYTESELLVSGTASTYSGPATGPASKFTELHRYVTRILVRRPADPSRFSGRALVEPLNTSSGADAHVVWSRVRSLIEAQGDAWIGVTVRASSVNELKSFDPVRYADVEISSNDLAWDMLRHVGALLRRPAGELLDGLTVRHLYMVGYSQSACDTATFAMAFTPCTRTAEGASLFDGYFPASHCGNLTPLQSGTARLPSFELSAVVDVEVPVIELQSQSDVEGFRAPLSSGAIYVTPGGAHVRRDDSDRPGDLYRLYEVAGSPHSPKVVGCDGEVSTFPTNAFIRAALTQLYRWAEDGIAPPRAARIEMATVDVVSVAKVDEYGNPLGGVRSPFLDVPLARYEVHSTPGARCQLSGRESPLPGDVVAARYGTVAGYVEEFTERLDATIDAGFLLDHDRSRLLDAQTAKVRRLLTATEG